MKMNQLIYPTLSDDPDTPRMEPPGEELNTQHRTMPTTSPDSLDFDFDWDWDSDLESEPDSETYSLISHSELPSLTPSRNNTPHSYSLISLSDLNTFTFTRTPSRSNTPEPPRPEEICLCIELEFLDGVLWLDMEMGKEEKVSREFRNALEERRCVVVRRLLDLRMQREGRGEKRRDRGRH